MIFLNFLIHNIYIFSSCWAFAAVSALESAIFLKTGESMSLSEQQLVDCTYRSVGHDGCQGGWMGDAYNYLIPSIGSDTSTAYPVRKQLGHYLGEILF